MIDEAVMAQLATINPTANGQPIYCGELLSGQTLAAALDKATLTLSKQPTTDSSSSAPLTPPAAAPTNIVGEFVAQAHFVLQISE